MLIHRVCVDSESSNTSSSTRSISCGVDVRTARRLLCGSALAVLMALPAVAEAQSKPDQSKPDAETSVGEVVVTARKREERLLEVPLAASILTGNDLLQRGLVVDPNQLLSGIPGVVFSNTGTPTTSEISIRGSGTSRGTAADSGVGLYFNGVYIEGGLYFGRNFERVDLFDLDQSEVLRGTQGALYGRDAVGGAINMISTVPAFNESGRLDFNYSPTLEQETVQAIYNHQVSEHVAIRLGIDYTDQDKGFFRNIDFDKYQDLTNGGDGRAQIRYRNDKIDADLLYEHQGLMEPILASQLLIAPTVALNTFPKGFSSDRRDINSSIPGKAYTNLDNLIGTATLDLGWATLSNVTSYRDTKAQHLYDADQFSTASLALARSEGNPAAATDPNINDLMSVRTKSAYEEVHLTGEQGPVTWLLGGDYLALNSHLLIGLTRTPTVANKSLGTDAHAVEQWDSGAVYGSLNYAFTKKWSLTAELRYTNDDKTQANYSNQINTTTITVAQTSRDVDTGHTDHNLTLSYKPVPSVMVYVKEGTGYRVGGMNPSNAPASPPAPKVVPSSYNDEDSETYEAGLKATVFRTLYVGLAAYKTRITNALAQQNNGCTVVLCGQAATSFLTNDGTADVWGLELESHYQFQLFGGSGKLDTGISRQGGKFQSGDFNGIELPYTPKLIASAGIYYVHPIPHEMQGFLNVDYHAQYGGIQDVTAPIYDLDSQDETNVRVGVRRQGWEFSGYINNVTNDQYALLRAANSIRWNGDLRTAGVELRYKW
jgi:iron complex outermembrane recepter protein